MTRGATSFAVRAWMLAACAALSACSIGKRDLPDAPPPLADLEEPLDRREEPADEDARRALPPGSFTGITVRAATDSLDALASDEGGLVVEGVVENSPADLAGVEAGDLIVEARANGAATSPRWPSDWREIELAAAPGARVELVLDRAGVERTAGITTVARARPAAREAAERFREEERVGVVLRTATEVEARAAGLAPGAGAVVVGLSRASPWRAAGLRYGDLVTKVGGEDVAHPQVVLDVVRRSDPGEPLVVTVVRDGAARDVTTSVTERDTETHSIDVPLLFSYENDRGRRETSVLLGIYKKESTPAAWRVRILWFIELSGGDADRLEELDAEEAAPAGAVEDGAR